MKIVKYKEALEKPVQDNNEPFVKGNKYEPKINLLIGASKRVPDKNPEIIFYIRDRIAQMLSEANQIIQKTNPNYNLGLGYGFRPMERQIKTFELKLAQIKAQNPDITDEDELYEMTNQFSAVPSMSAHPTGGAVDVAIQTPDGNLIDMGFPFLDIFNEDSSQISWLAENLTQEQETNRKLLLNAMTDVGFAPYWGEWWHYSYGDREWAVFYDQPTAIYSQKSTEDVLQYLLK